MSDRNPRPGVGGSTATGHVARPSVPGRAGRWGWLAFGAVAFLLATQWPVLEHGLAQLRAANSDQMGYLAISADVSDGSLARVEPYTQTGLNSYPRGYYTLVGLVSRALGNHVVVAWNLVGLLLQLVMVLSLGLVLQSVSRRAWAGALSGMPFLVGVLAWTRGAWRIGVGGSHANLWGLFATLGCLNGESAGLALLVVSLSLLALAWLVPARHPVALTLLSCALVGLTANVQTYSFLLGTWVLAWLGAACGLAGAGPRAGRRPRRGVAISGCLLVLLYLTGPLVSRLAGQLPTLVYGLLPTVPGLVLLLRRWRPVLAGALVLGACAAPQVLLTLHDQAVGSPFLAYRTASNHDLGVVHPWTLVASLPVVLPLAWLLLRGGRDVAIWCLAGVPLLLWVVASTNDVWGANAEPYRFWVEAHALAAMAALVGCLRLLPGRGEPMARGVRTALYGFTALAVLASGDLGHWWADPGQQALWDPSTSRMRAVTRAAALTPTDALLGLDTCLDAQASKVMAHRPVAYYRRGMAWPARRDQVDRYLAQRMEVRATAGTLRAAGIEWLLLDTGCRPTMASSVAGFATRVARVGYQGDPGTLYGGEVDAPAEIDVWRVDASGG